jgi:heme oxygenase
MRQVANAVVHLNVETCAYHGLIDRFWLEPITSQADYVRRLVRAYGFEAPLEAAIAYTPNLGEVLDLAPRFRAGLIAQDLMTLGLEPWQVSAIPQHMVAPFGSADEAMGWLYVHQRGTLTHDAARRDLLSRLPRLGPATSYLGAYAGTAGVHWDDFGMALDRIAATVEVTQRIVSAAHDAFRAALQWFAKPQRA